MVRFWHLAAARFRFDDAQFGIAMVQEAINSGEFKTIAGPVHAVELERGKPFHWIKRKDYCAEQN